MAHCGAAGGIFALRARALKRLPIALLFALTGACAGSSPSAPAPVPGPGVPLIVQVRVAGLPPELTPGAVAQLRAEVVLATGSVKECTAAWSVDDTRVATVSSTGLLTARLTGYARVTAACEGFSAQADAKVAAANPYQLIIVAYDSEVPSEFGVVTEMEFLEGPSAGQKVPTSWIFTNGIPGVAWPVRVRFTAEDFAPKEFVLSEATGQRRNSNSPLFDFRVPMTYVGDASTDSYVRTMSREVMQISHPFTMRLPGPVKVRTWWSVDYNDRLFVELWCNGELLASRTQVFGSAGSGLEHSAPAGSCEVRLRQSKSDAGTHYRVAIKYAR